MKGKTKNKNKKGLVRKKKELVYEIDEKPELKMAIPLALQHLLSMFGATVLVPLIVGGALSLSQAQQTLLIQLVLLTMGIATILQSLFGSRLPIVQGSSFAFLPPMISAPSLASIAGGLIVGGIGEALVGFSGLVGKLKHYFTPAVTGVTVILIGLSLAGVAVNQAFSGSSLESGIAIITLFSIVLIATRAKGTLKLMPVLIGFVIGYIVAFAFGLVNLEAFNNASLLSIPKPLPWGLEFDTKVIIGMIFAFLVSIIESVGDYHAVATASRVKLTSSTINKGIGMEGVASFISGILGGVGTTSYSENIGVVAITKVASRYVVALAGAFLILLSFIPKIAGLLSTVPSCVLGGATLVLYGMISVTGLRIIKDNVEINTRNMLVIGVALIMGVGIAFLPKEVLSSLPELVRAIAESGMATGALTAIILDNILPKKE